jgi:hypothetical protein
MLESEAPTDVLEAIAQQHDMTREETVRFNLTGRTTHVWRINGNTPVPVMLENVAIHPEITGGQPIYFFVLAQSAQTQANAEQYAPQKLHLTEAHVMPMDRRGQEASRLLFLTVSTYSTCRE